MECRLENLTELGEGSFGIVYSARNMDTGEEEAVKVFKRSSDFLNSLREIDVLMRINNPFLLKGVNFYQKSNCFQGKDGIGTKLYKGDVSKLGPRFINLEADLLSMYDFNTVKTIIGLSFEKFTYQTLSALKCLHAAGYYHLDIKPENILYEYTLEPFDINFYLADFGLVYPGEKDIEYDYVAGTMFFMAPELTNLDQCNKRSDVWSMGVTMAEVIIGEEFGKLENDQFYNYFRNGVFNDVLKRAKEEYDQQGNVLNLLDMIGSMLKINFAVRPLVKDLSKTDTSCVFESSIGLGDLDPQGIMTGISQMSSLAKDENIRRKFFGGEEVSIKEFLLAISIYIRLLQLGVVEPEFDSILLARKFYKTFVNLNSSDTERLTELVLKLQGIIFVNPLYDMISSEAQFDELFYYLTEDITSIFDGSVSFDNVDVIDDFGNTII